MKVKRIADKVAVIPRHPLMDKRLSLGAKGLLSTLIALSYDGEEATIDKIAEISDATKR